MRGLACPQMRFDRGWTERFAGIVTDPVDFTEAHPGHDVGVMLAGRDQDGLLFPVHRPQAIEFSASVAFRTKMT